MNLEKLEKQVTLQEDIQEIENLQRIYSYYFESQNIPGILDLWSENAESVEITDHGLFKGKAGVKKLFWDWIGGGGERRGPPMSGGIVRIFQMQGVVDVAPDGKTAEGRWNCLDLEARPYGGFFRNYWLHGYYENKYVKENGKWLFTKLHWNNTFWTPYEAGWLKIPLLGRMDEHPTIKADAPPTAFHPYPYHKDNVPYHYKHPITGK